MATMMVPEALRPVVGMGQILLGRPPISLTAILGSCIGVVLHHPRMKVVAAAHVVLPDSMGRSATPGKFADTAVPEMIRNLAAEGVPASGLVAKIVGGANMFGTQSGPMQIGENNAAAVRKALTAAGIRVAAEHLGGGKGRRIHVDCATGDVTIESVGSPNVVI